MLFLIRRTSCYNKKRPADCAKVITGPEHLSTYYGWYIELESLGDLIELSNLEGDLLFSSTHVEGFDGEIEIYDDYRE